MKSSFLKAVFVSASMFLSCVRSNDTNDLLSFSQQEKVKNRYDFNYFDSILDKIENFVERDLPV